MKKFNGHFTNKEYDLDIEIENNFSNDNILYSLKMTVDNISFVGMEFADFELENKDDHRAASKTFDLIKWGENPNYHYELERYALSFEIPIQVIEIETNAIMNSILQISFSKIKDIEKTTNVRTTLNDVRVFRDLISYKKFDLKINKKVYKAENPNLDFENSLIQICHQISGNYYLKCCFGCLYSDYSPSGNGFFGTMVCLVKRVEEYIKVSSKIDLFDIFDDGNQVQETYVCKKFQPRTKINFDGGYRGFIYND